jgi:predicted extracellular nuclease
MKIKILVLSYIIPLLFISCSRDEPTIVGTNPPPPTVTEVKINEVYSMGDSTNPDWIEIYNPTSSQVDLSGYKIYNNVGQSGSKPKKEFSAGTVIPANSFFVIVVGDTTIASWFDLLSSGETVWLEKANGSIIDSINIPSLGIDTSYARNPNGSTNWIKLTPPTKGVSNGLFPVVMNEIYSRGVPADPDWIEIYNPNSESVDITGYKIYDVGGKGGTKPKKLFPANTIVPPNGFFVIVTDNSPDPSYFGLSSAGEEVWLENVGGNIIDDVTFPAMPDTTTSYGRLPDGSVNWQILNTRTRGSSNHQ